MTRPRPFHPAVDGAVALAAVLYGAAGLWRMQWLGEDWGRLWSALDADTAPAGAGGLFPQPLARLPWDLAATVAGDAPWAMHVLMFCAWLVLVTGAIRWHRHFGGGHGGALVVGLVLANHAALVATRLWATAAGSVVAAALVVWGAYLLAEQHRLRARLAGVLLVVLAVLVRADAAALLVLPAIARSVRRRPVGAPLAALAVLGVIALAWVWVFRSPPVLRPADGAHLLRMLVLPWGPSLAVGPAAVGGVIGIALCLGAGRLLAVAAPRASACLLVTGALALAVSMVAAAPSGRDVLMPAVSFALVLGAWWDGYARGGPSARGHRIVRGGIAAWILASLITVPLGGETRALLARSHQETALYRTLQAAAPLAGDHLTLLNPPSAAWDDAAADLSLLAGAALRRPITVGVGAAGHVAVPYPAADWSRGAWRLWTDRTPGGRRVSQR